MTDFQGLNLMRVVRVDAQEDMDVRVLAVELFEDGVGVRHVLPSGIRPPEGPAHILDSAFALSDDVGTNYRWIGGGSSGAPVAHGIAFFVPAVPDDAASLTVATRGGVITVDLG